MDLKFCNWTLNPFRNVKTKSLKVPFICLIAINIPNINIPSFASLVSLFSGLDLSGWFWKTILQIVLELVVPATSLGISSNAYED